MADKDNLSYIKSSTEVLKDLVGSENEETEIIEVPLWDEAMAYLRELNIPEDKYNALMQITAELTVILTLDDNENSDLIEEKIQEIKVVMSSLTKETQQKAGEHLNALLQKFM